MKENQTAVLFVKTGKGLQMTLLFAFMLLFIFSPCPVRKGFQSLLAQQMVLKNEPVKKEVKGVFHTQTVLNVSIPGCSVYSFRSGPDEYIFQKNQSDFQALQLSVFILPDFLLSILPVEKQELVVTDPGLKSHIISIPLFLQNRKLVI